MLNENELPGSADKTAPPVSVADIAETVTGPIEWVEAGQGYCECPGRHLHTGHDGPRDCIVYLDHVPTIHCLHASCRGEVENRNRELRRSCANAAEGDATKPKRMTAEQKLRVAQARCRENVRRRASNSRERILREHHWPLREMLKDSPVKVPGDPVAHTSSLLARFHPDDVVWIGDKFDSGKPEHAVHFRTAREWLAEPNITGPLICPATFKPGTHRRANDQIVTRRFLVVESDTLGKDDVGAIFRWLREAVKLPLMAIVDTAGKSLHAWFDYPAAEAVAELQLVLPGLGCDPKLFTASQPVRLPGCLRHGKYQQLVYLGTEVGR